MHRKLKIYLREKACQIIDKLWSMVTDDMGPIDMAREIIHLHIQIEERDSRLGYFESQPISWKEA